MSNFTFKDNSKEALNAFLSQTTTALQKIGLVAEGYAKLECPVDTGRLRNSITNAIADKSVYIGTNVEYG